MECNKDEAIRAMEIAEKNMEKNDFEGARKIAKKAQSIYPELENISQLLTICDVHCSSLKKILGSEKDWYDILQVERLADELTVKKQYRRLALFLHPDKNRFPGAEAAFKLICEANAVLSDPAKKSLYDTKMRASVRPAPVYPPTHHANKNFQFNNAHRAQNSVYNGFTSLNLHKAAGSSSTFSQESFWTSCPFCSFRYKYPRGFVNKTLRCQRCSKDFMACEISLQGIPIGSKWGPHSVQPMPSKPSSNQTAVQNENGFLPVHTDSWSNACRTTVQPEKGIQTGNSSGDARTVGTSNGDAATRESRDLKRKGGTRSRKRGRKQVVESSESFDSSSESEFEEDASSRANLNDSKIETNSGPNGVHFPRRSTRTRQHVVYNESDDDFSFPTEGLQARTSRKDIEKEQKKVFGGEDSTDGVQNSFHTDADYSKSEGKPMGTVHPERNFQDNGAGYDELRVRGESGGKPHTDADTVEIESDSDQDSYSGDNPDVGVYHCPDTEFHNFDDDRHEKNFDVDQIWACYDDVDGMPRFYAKMKMIFRSPFKLAYTWLEVDTKNEASKKCMDEQLPISCGCFKLGKTERTSRVLSFSHQMENEKGPRRASFIIYPREGETWALFHNMDMKPSSNPNNRQFKYEVVEVLSDLVAGAGIKVAYLEKISGFASLFRRTSESESDSFLIGPDELYKFSHRVPCYKMKGNEREGVLEGSFELDPASLPLNPDDMYYPGKADIGPGTLKTGSVGQQNELKKGKSVIPEFTTTPKEFVDLEEMEDEDF